MQNFADRRQFPRTDRLVSVRQPGEDTPDAWLTTRDISAGGMRLLSERALAKGDRLELEMLMLDGSWLPLQTKVAWSVKLDVGSTAEYEVGLRFLDLTQADLDRLEPLLPKLPEPHIDGGRRDLGG